MLTCRPPPILHIEQVAITLDYRYQPEARAPIDAGYVVSGNGSGAGYRYQFPEVSLKGRDTVGEF